ncbi:hypothetical protein CVT26_003988 [Gymnopilus dilepis]|uniref:BTB domain-containing protein n=1 Tax=Gymnopilus dilepis TaxID=231916 RepID=A0A409YV14_9AGAR|nr:hypothetical protein CVT26_003988 [Gymnopilus dilepis]
MALKVIQNERGRIGANLTKKSINCMDPNTAFQTTTYNDTTTFKLADNSVNSTSGTTSLATRDSTFYFNDVVFQVEDTLFKVPKDAFTIPGSFFETLFSLPRSEDEECKAEGSDDEHPLVLERISKDYFRGLLSVMFPSGNLRRQIRKRAIAALSGLLQKRTAVTKILLGQQYRVKKWFVDGCIALIQMNEFPAIEDLIKNGLDIFAIAKLLSIREKCSRFIMSQLASKPAHCIRCGAPDYDPKQVTYIVSVNKASTLLDACDTPAHSSAALVDSMKNPGDIESETNGPPARDRSFYFNDVVFQVENTLFKVPKNAFTVPGSFFETLFSLPRSEEGESIAEGSDDEHPLVLEKISKDHFKGLLSVMFPRQSGLKYEQWLGALDLSTQWDFMEASGIGYLMNDQIRKKAVHALSSLLQKRTAIEKILLGQKYRVKNWFVGGCASLIQAAELPAIEELIKSGLDIFAIAKLFSIREACARTIIERHASKPGYCRSCRHCGDQKPKPMRYSVPFSYASTAVRESFKTELATLEEF